MKKLSIVQMEEVMGGSVWCRLLNEAGNLAMISLQIEAALDIALVYKRICPSN